MNLKKLFATSAVFALAVSLFAPAINTAKAEYNAEIKGAYEYAFSKKVTTLPTVDAAFPMGKAIRGHVAKMISNWASEVLEVKADTTITPKFTDISGNSSEIQGYIVKSAQQKLMGQGGEQFRPLANVTRGEFGTILSRALYGAANNGGTPFYAKHLEALKKAGIMNDLSNPQRPVLRYEIWLMLKRAENLKGGTDNGTDGLTAEQLLACLSADDYMKCIADAKGEVKDKDDNKDEDEDEEVVIEKKGDLSLKLAKSTPDGRIPLNIDRVPMTKFTASANGEDVKLYSVTLDDNGLGDSKNIYNVSIYNKDDLEVAKSTKNFGSRDDITLTFVKDLTIKKGGSETFTVVAYLSGGSNTNTTYGLSVVDMNTSAKDVDGLSVKGNDMETMTVSNVAKLKVTGGSEGGKLEAGEDKTLASFKIEETEDKEDAELSSIKLTIDGDDDVKFDNLKLYADGDEVKDAKIRRNANDELTISLDYTIPQDKKVEFKLKGTVSELADGKFSFIVEKTSDVFARGAKRGYNAAVTMDENLKVSGDWTTEGAEITASFDKSNRDEVKDDSDDVLFGTLKLKSNGTNYTLHDYTIEVSVSAGNVKEVVKDLKLGGTTYDKVTGDETTTAKFSFDEIDIRNGETLKLPITLDIEKDVANDITVTVKADINGTKLENTDDDKDYTSSTSPKLLSHFSSTDFSDKKMTVEQPTLTWNIKSLNDRDIILGNQDEIVYKAKVSVGDADSVKLKDVKFDAEITATDGTATLDELVQGATLEIGEKSYSDDDITASQISFSSINHKFEEGESNVDVYLTVKMKSKDGFAGTLKLKANKSTVSAEDSDGDDLKDAKITMTDTFGPVLTVSDHGELVISTYLEDENGTLEINSVESDKFAVAGSEGKVVIGKLKLKAEREEFKIEELVFEGKDTEGKFDDSVKEYSLSIDGTEAGAVESTVSGDVLTLKFKNVNHTLEKGKVKYANVYATLKKLDLDASAPDSAKLGAKLEGLKLVEDGTKYEGKDSGDDETTTGLVKGIPTDEAKSTTVTASNIATIELVKVQKALVSGENEVAQLKITSTSTTNVDEDGEKIYPWLKSLKAEDFNIAGSKGFTATITKIEKVGGSTGAVAVGDTLNDTLKTDAEIKGTVTYKIYADVSALGDADSPYAEVKLNDASSIVFLQYEKAEATETVKYFVPRGTSRSQTVSTK